MERSELDRLDHVMEEAFRVEHKTLRKDGPLRAYIECILATHLVYLPDVIALCSESHVVAVRLINAGRDQGFSKRALLDWGVSIKAAQLLSTQRPQDVLPEELKRFTETLEQYTSVNQKSHTRMEKGMAAMAERLVTLENAVAHLPGAIHNIERFSPQSQSDIRKRRRLSGEEKKDENAAGETSESVAVGVGTGASQSSSSSAPPSQSSSSSLPLPQISMNAAAVSSRSVNEVLSHRDAEQITSLKDYTVKQAIVAWFCDGVESAGTTVISDKNKSRIKKCIDVLKRFATVEQHAVINKKAAKLIGMEKHQWRDEMAQVAKDVVTRFETRLRLVEGLCGIESAPTAKMNVCAVGDRIDAIKKKGHDWRLKPELSDVQPQGGGNTRPLKCHADVGNNNNSTQHQASSTDVNDDELSAMMDNVDSKIAAHDSTVSSSIVLTSSSASAAPANARVQTTSPSSFFSLNTLASSAMGMMFRGSSSSTDMDVTSDKDS